MLKQSKAIFLTLFQVTEPPLMTRRNLYWLILQFD